MRFETHARYAGWRVYKHIAQKLAADDGAPLRLMIQASAGTGASPSYAYIILQNALGCANAS